MNLSIKPLSVYFALAVAFKNAKAYDDAIASYMKQADVQKQTGSYAFYLVIKSEKDFFAAAIPQLLKFVIIQLV